MADAGHAFPIPSGEDRGEVSARHPMPGHRGPSAEPEEPEVPEPMRSARCTPRNHPPTAEPEAQEAQEAQGGPEAAEAAESAGAREHPVRGFLSGMSRKGRFPSS